MSMRRCAAPLLLALPLLVAACGSGGADSTAAPAVQQQPDAAPQPDAVPEPVAVPEPNAAPAPQSEPEPALRIADDALAGFPVYDDEATGIRTILGTPDLGAGRHRVGFVLSDAVGLIRLPVVRAESFFYPNGLQGPRQGPLETGLASFFEFPLGVRGMYSLELSFDRPGDWELEVSIPRPDGSVAVTAFAFPVAERTLSPAVGEPAPRSRNRTIRDVGSLAELTTGSKPDPALYLSSIAEAIDRGAPAIVVFASPAFCTNALCGPQVEVVSELAAEYLGRAEFIHIDLYDNPHEVGNDLSRGIRSPHLAEWGLETDEWTFVIDEEGRVASRFEAFVTHDELKSALLRVLDG